MVIRTVRTLASVGVLATTAACGVADHRDADPIDAHSAQLTISTSSAIAEDEPVVADDRSERVVRSKFDTILTDDFALVTDAVAQYRAQRVDAPDPTPSEAIEQVWLDLAECESNQRWDYNGASGYDGGLQFHPATWRAVGGEDFARFAWQATPREQVTVAERLLEVQGWGAWPACSRKLDLR